MTFIRTYFLVLSLLIFAIQVNAQRVTVSDEINVRNDYAYHLLGKIDDVILLYQDKGRDKKLLLFNDQLELQSERFLRFPQKRALIYELVNIDTAFCVFYGFRDEDDNVLSMAVFSSKAELIDSIEISRNEKQWKGMEFQATLSEDNTKIALYNILSNEQLRLSVYDFVKRELLLSQDYLVRQGNLIEDFRQALLSNSGEFFLLTERFNTRVNKEKHSASIYHFKPVQESADEIILPLHDILCSDIKMSYNNTNNRLGLAGLYDEKKVLESVGYFWVESTPSQFDNVEILLTPFEDIVFFEVYGDKDDDRLENFMVGDVIYKANGAPIIVFEMQADVSRRGGGSYYASSFIGSWSDHYREDLIIISLLPDGRKHWHQVFYKKQFSQNDQAIYSSFFTFLTPSRVRLIYNDEIKDSNTVSEYVFDGKGNFKRTSLLSTEYQNLRLRFADALQLSSTQLLVPSQKSYALNLVKIDYAR